MPDNITYTYTFNHHFKSTLQHCTCVFIVDVCIYRLFVTGKNLLGAAKQYNSWTARTRYGIKYAGKLITYLQQRVCLRTLVVSVYNHAVTCFYHLHPLSHVLFQSPPNGRFITF